MTRKEVVNIEIEDIDEATTKDDIYEALCKELEANIEKTAIHSLRKAYKCTQTAMVQIPKDAAITLLKRGRLRIGWVNCRIREKVDPIKCFKCWAFGHKARECKGTDRSKCCLRCGEVGHSRKSCKRNEPKCVLCSTKENHPTGSFGCTAYQEAMKALKKK